MWSASPFSKHMASVISKTIYMKALTSSFYQEVEVVSRGVWDVAWAVEGVGESFWSRCSVQRTRGPKRNRVCCENVYWGRWIFRPHPVKVALKFGSLNAILDCHSIVKRVEKFVCTRSAFEAPCSYESRIVTATENMEAVWHSLLKSAQSFTRKHPTKCSLSAPIARRSLHLKFHLCEMMVMKEFSSCDFLNRLVRSQRQFGVISENALVFFSVEALFQLSWCINK